MEQNLQDGITLYEAFLLTATTYPEAVAIEFETKSLTYSALKSRAIELYDLLKLRNKLNPFVVLLLPPCPEHVIASLAALYAQKVIVTPHINYAPTQLERRLAQFQNPIIVTSSIIWEGFSSLNYKNLYLIDKTPELSQGTPDSFEPIEDIKNVAYIFLTSGTTGDSKAVMVTHQNVLKQTNSQIALHPDVFNSKLRGALSVSLSFRPTTSDVWNVFRTGGTLVIPPQHIRLDINAYRLWLTANRITTVCLATSLFESLISKHVESLTTLRWVWFIGAKLNRNRVCLKDAKFDTYFGYGSTEMNVAANCHIPPGTLRPSGAVGRPYPGSGVTIVTETGETINAPDVKGVICVSGDGLMKGYYGQPALTEKVMFTDSTGKRQYNTGDIGYWNIDGDLVVVGRKDHQVKIHGVRLELGDVETAISEYPGILDTVVVLKNIGDTQQLVAFCKVMQEQTFSSAELQKFLVQKIQRHAIPATFTFLTQFPSTASGKVDRQSLARLANESHIANAQEDESKLTTLVRGVWEAVLGHSNFTSTDNFFYIGGNSVHAFSVVSHLKKTIDNISVAQIFQTPVLRDFVASLEQTVAPSVDSIIDWSREVSISNFGTKPNHDRPCDNVAKSTGIFITGATGYLGSFLLKQSLQAYPVSKMYLIIRAKTDKDAQLRIFSLLASRGVDVNDEVKARVVCFAGDIAKNNFGISLDNYEVLNKNVGIIFHAAADVSFMKTYTQLRDSTVGMTINVIKFADAGTSKKRIHFMSSVGVFDEVQDVDRHVPGTIYEAKEDILPLEVQPKEMTMGYFQSKWVSEQLVTKAGSELRIPVSIYRIAHVGADEFSSSVNRRDTLTGFVIACLKLGIHPSLEQIKLPFVDATSASQGILKLSQLELKSSALRVFHIVAKNVQLLEFFDITLTKVPLQIWASKFKETLTSDGPTSEDDINAWVFLEMINQIKIGHRNLMTNISFDVTKTIKNFENFDFTANPSMFTSILKKSIS